MTAGVVTSKTASPLAGLATAYRLGLSSVITRGRVLTMGGLVGFVLLLFGIFGSDVATGDATSVVIVAVLGLILGVLVPVVSVTTATSAMGAAVTDNNLVYFWLRPVARWKLAVGHIAAVLTLVLPVALVATGGSALLLVRLTDSPDSGRAILAIMASAALTALAYCPILVGLGLRFKRASTFAFVYIFFFETVLARSSTGLSRLSIQTYVNSAYFGIGQGDETIGPQFYRLVGLGPALLVLVLVAAGGVGLTTFFLKRTDVA